MRTVSVVPGIPTTLIPEAAAADRTVASHPESIT